MMSSSSIVDVIIDFNPLVTILYQVHSNGYRKPLLSSCPTYQVNATNVTTVDTLLLDAVHSMHAAAKREMPNLQCEFVLAENLNVEWLEKHQRNMSTNDTFIVIVLIECDSLDMKVTRDALNDNVVLRSLVRSGDAFDTYVWLVVDKTERIPTSLLMHVKSVVNIRRINNNNEFSMVYAFV